MIDSFASRTLRALAEMARLRGAVTVIVGIQPDVAFAMVRLGMGMGAVPTALDLEEGLGYLAELTGHVTRPAAARSPDERPGGPGPRLPHRASCATSRDAARPR